MAVIIGSVLALLVGAMATAVGFDRDRAMYPIVTFVVASYYVLFAAMGASNETIAWEIAAGAVFAVAAVLGFRCSLWIVVAALAGHGIFDLFHGAVIDNPVVPHWWAGFCSAYDVAAAAYLAWLIRSRKALPPR